MDAQVEAVDSATVEGREAPSPRVPPKEPCLVCGGTEFRFRFEKKGRHFWQCRGCDLELQHPLPTADELRDYYDGSYQSGLYREFVDAAEMKRLTAERRFAEIAPHVPKGRWLDVGCADGRFLEVAAAHGCECEGIDLSSVAVDLARERGVTAHTASIAEFEPDRPYDVITGFDVIEHVLDPAAFLRDARRLLAPGGCLALTTPDRRSVFRRLMGKRWYFYIPEEHLHYFDRRTIARAFENYGLETVHTGRTHKPLTFEYGLTQFREYNPWIHRVLRAGAVVLPRSLERRPIPWYIGEMLAIGRRAD